MRKPAFFALPQLTRRQMPSGDHPDADLLAAFAEQKLSKDERATVVEHLAECSDCREILALTSVVCQDQAPSVSAIRERGLAWWPWRAAVLAAAFFVAVIATWQFSLFRRPAVQAPISKLDQITLSKPQLMIVTPPAPRSIERQMQTTARAPARAKRASSRPSRTVPSPERPAEKLGGSLIAGALQPEVTSPALAKRSRIAPETLERYAFAPNQMFSSNIAPAPVRTFMPEVRNNEKTVWSLEGSPEPGAVRKSDDGGKTWHTVSIDGFTRFYALSAAGSNIWLGGADGKLFRSTDDGAHWHPIAVFDGTIRLTDAIVGIDSQGEKITLRTIPGATFTTNDGGTQWRRQ